MTQPTPTHIHATSIYDVATSARLSSIETLSPAEGAYDYDTGLPTEFHVIAGLASAAPSLRVKTFDNAEERDAYIEDDPDGLLA